MLPQGMSETFETLHNLVHKGVKVVMDIPYELWNETSAEVADLKKQVPSPVGLALGGRLWAGVQGERGSGGALPGTGVLAGPAALVLVLPWRRVAGAGLSALH